MDNKEERFILASTADCSYPGALDALVPIVSEFLDVPQYFEALGGDDKGNPIRVLCASLRDKVYVWDVGCERWSLTY